MSDIIKELLGHGEGNLLDDTGLTIYKQLLVLIHIRNGGSPRPEDYASGFKSSTLFIGPLHNLIVSLRVRKQTTSISSVCVVISAF